MDPDKTKTAAEILGQFLGKGYEAAKAAFFGRTPIPKELTPKMAAWYIREAVIKYLRNYDWKRFGILNGTGPAGLPSGAVVAVVRGLALARAWLILTVGATLAEFLIVAALLMLAGVVTFYFVMRDTSSDDEVSRGYADWAGTISIMVIPYGASKCSSYPKDFPDDWKRDWVCTLQRNGTCEGNYGAHCVGLNWVPLPLPPLTYNGPIRLTGLPMANPPYAAGPYANLRTYAELEPGAKMSGDYVDFFVHGELGKSSIIETDGGGRCADTWASGSCSYDEGTYINDGGQGGGHRHIEISLEFSGDRFTRTVTQTQMRWDTIAGTSEPRPTATQTQQISVAKQRSY